MLFAIQALTQLFSYSHSLIPHLLPNGRVSNDGLIQSFTRRSDIIIQITVTILSSCFLQATNQPYRAPTRTEVSQQRNNECILHTYLSSHPHRKILSPLESVRYNKSFSLRVRFNLSLLVASWNKNERVVSCGNGKRIFTLLNRNFDSVVPR